MISSDKGHHWWFRWRVLWWRNTFIGAFPPGLNPFWNEGCGGSTYFVDIQKWIQKKYCLGSSVLYIHLWVIFYTILRVFCSYSNAIESLLILCLVLRLKFAEIFVMRGLKWKYHLVFSRREVLWKVLLVFTVLLLNN